MVQQRFNLFVPLVCASLNAFPMQAQEVIDLGAISTCNGCQLRARPIAVLGEESGPGIIESETMRVVHDSHSGMYAVFSSRILLFDSTGSFVRSIGRRGGGPEEISRLVDVHFNGSEIVILDNVGPKFMVMDLQGRYIRDFRLPVQAGSFRITSDTSVVVGSMDRRPSLVGYPLHHVLLSTGEAIKHFGSTDGEWNAREPYARQVVLGWSPNPERIWRGHLGRFHLEEWGLDGRLLRSVTGEPGWFVDVRNRDDDSPWSFVMDFGTDTKDRLWLLVRVADPDWRAVQLRGRERLIYPEDENDYWDMRIDVFDLREKRHLGSMIWDEASASLVQIRGEFALQKVTYDDDLVPRVTLYRIGFETQN